MSKIRDLLGRRFGKLLVVGPSAERTAQGLALWICQCDCGNILPVIGHNLGRCATSCGCVHRTQGGLAEKHHLYEKWCGMMKRCFRPKNGAYQWYGARGITVCERWKSFPHFVADMEPTYFPGATIERNDVNGNYEPSNCRWATQREQTRNKRTNVFIEFKGERLILADWSSRIGVGRRTLAMRLKTGWPPELALTRPVTPRSLRRIGKPA